MAADPKTRFTAVSATPFCGMARRSVLPTGLPMRAPARLQFPALRRKIRLLPASNGLSPVIRLRPVAADLDGTAGGEQLAAYLEQERSQIRTAATPDALFDMLRAAREAGQRCVIDLPAINPFDQDDMASLQDLIQVVRAEPVLVMSAEGHPEDQADAARIFARAGIRRAILTKLDIARRRGGVISALSSAGIAFSHLAVTPFIGGGLVPAAPSRLAALLMEDAPGDVIALKGAA